MRPSPPHRWIWPQLFALGLLVGCSDPTSNGVPVTGRWYTPNQVNSGELLFQTHCVSCHKAKAEGTTNWKQCLADGSLPPPPLNGTAHAWHHALPVLLRTIEQGGVPLGGTMPAFQQLLSTSERLAVVAYIQSLWSDEIYQNWQQRN